MLIERFEERGLSHYSYAVGCAEKGQIAIIDPRFDVEIYLEYAEKNQLVISHVFETHIHADYASGARYLAARTKATLALSAYDKGEKYEVNFPHKECFDGDIFRLGSITLQVIHTPGHTPEHISFLAYEAGKPKALFSGDFLFVGSVGRPDLLGEEEAFSLTKKLYTSVREKLKGLPDSLPIFPCHGPGSLCGGGMLKYPSSTLGQEKLSNPFLNSRLTEKEFMALIAAKKLPFPDYFRRMKEYNSRLERKQIAGAAPLEVEEFQQKIEQGAAVIDLRDKKAFSAGHIPGAICIGAGEKLGFWAATAIPYDTPILLVTPNPLQVKEAILSLARVGLVQVVGYLKGGNEHWVAKGLPQEIVGEVMPEELVSSTVSVIDVRSRSEWEGGHLEGAIHISCSELSQRINELPQEKLLFICAGGNRSILAASIAKKSGRKEVSHLPGGLLSCQPASFVL